MKEVTAVQDFVDEVRCGMRREERYSGLPGGVMLVECDKVMCCVWDVFRSANSRPVQDYLKRSPFVAVVYLDGSAQLLSRDEDECRLFATLWELGK